jgi:hypothetical protein
MTNDNPYTYALTADPCKPMREAQELIKRLTAERDEARRMYCGRVSRDVPLDAFDIAKNHGWDCFPQEDGK